jgi:hypothetical protein
MNIFKSVLKLWRIRKEVATMDAKGLLQSKTIWGIVISVIAQILKRYGITIDETGVTNDILSIIASGFAVYGRYAVDKTITGLLK